MDLETGVVVGMTVQTRMAGDTTNDGRDADARGGAGGSGDCRGARVAEVVGTGGITATRWLVALASWDSAATLSEPASRAAPLAGQTGGAGRSVWQPAANSVCPGAALAAQRGDRLERPNAPSLRNRGPAPGCICADTPTSSSAFWVHAYGFNLGFLIATG